MSTRTHSPFKNEKSPQALCLWASMLLLLTDEIYL